MMKQTPYYLIDERRLLKNLKMIQQVRRDSGAKIVLALKCFSTWSVFDLMRRFMDGTTSSSAYEARLGREKFGKEVHAYCVGYDPEDIAEVRGLADKIIFNSVSQLKRFHRLCSDRPLGLRVNPKVSYSNFDLADPARKFSRLGVTDQKQLFEVLGLLSGVMFHFNCENDNFKNFSFHLDLISRKFGKILDVLSWVSLGGGIYFTKEGYPLKEFCSLLKNFSCRHGVQVYLEPGEAVITQAAELVTKVLDLVHNGKKIAIVDASTEAHMLDLLIYRMSAKVKKSSRERFSYIVAGRSCLAGDVFGEFAFSHPLRVGSIVRFKDAAGYTMCKKNWFNGLKMPSIVVKRLNGKTQIVRRFTYRDFEKSLS